MRREPLWQKPAADLTNNGTESGDPEHVRTRAGAEQKLQALEAEIAGEIACALGRTEESLKLALAELELRSEDLVRLRTCGANGPDLREAIDAFNQQRGIAEKRLLDLVIHREAAGFRRNQAVYERYRIPPPER